MRDEYDHLRESADAGFEREAYLSLADEFDPHGATRTPTLDEFDKVYVDAARAFAARYDLPFPMYDGIDHAVELVRQAERQSGETR